jgi:hypothetical protein
MSGEAAAGFLHYYSMSSVNNVIYGPTLRFAVADLLSSAYLALELVIMWSSRVHNLWP